MLGKPKEVFRSNEADKVREIRSVLQWIMDYVREQKLSLPVVMTIEENGIKARLEIKS